MPKITWQDVPGWTDWFDLYDEVAMTTPPHSTIVEVGVCFGRSLLYLAQKIKEIGRPGVQIVAVDPWVPYPEHHFIWDGSAQNDSERAAYRVAQEHDGTFNAFLFFLYNSGLGDYVNVIRATSVDAAKMFVDKPPHFVFIDAEHTAEAVAQDLHSWWDLVKPEWIAGHDYNRGSERDFPGVWKTVDAKFGVENVEWRGQTCFVVRRSHLERPRP
jgi:Methyltransferase domain